MKNILKISIPFYIAFLVFLLIGRFKIFITLTLFTLFHELGHIIIGIIFKYKIEKIIILPLGCLTIFNKRINDSLIKELLLTIMGPLFQILIFIVLKDELYIKYNLILLVFNLLPIYPLDGYKILLNIIYLVFSFLNAKRISLLISILFLILLIILRPTSLIIYLIFIIYIIQIIKEYRILSFLFNKFLLERYLYNIKYKDRLFIKGDKKSKMKMYKNHDFLIGNKLVEEHEILNKMFDNT